MPCEHNNRHCFTFLFSFAWFSGEETRINQNPETTYCIFYTMHMVARLPEPHTLKVPHTHDSLGNTLAVTCAALNLDMTTHVPCLKTRTESPDFIDTTSMRRLVFVEDQVTQVITPGTKLKTSTVKSAMPMAKSISSTSTDPRSSRAPIAGTCM